MLDGGLYSIHCYLTGQSERNSSPGYTRVVDGFNQTYMSGRSRSSWQFVAKNSERIVTFYQDRESCLRGIDQEKCILMAVTAWWSVGRAYLDNAGNYRLKVKGSPVARWNTYVKRRMTCGQLHQLASNSNE